MGEKDVIDNIIIIWLPTYNIFQVQKCVKKKSAILIVSTLLYIL